MAAGRWSDAVDYLRAYVDGYIVNERLSGSRQQPAEQGWSESALEAHTVASPYLPFLTFTARRVLTLSNVRDPLT